MDGCAGGQILSWEFLIRVEALQRLAGGMMDGRCDLGRFPRGSLIHLTVNGLPLPAPLQAEIQTADQRGPERVVGELLFHLLEEIKRFLVFLFVRARVILGEVEFGLRPCQFALIGAESKLLEPLGAAAAGQADKDAENFTMLERVSTK